MRVAIVFSVLLGLAGCAAPGPRAAWTPERLAAHRVVLLGEVHDNADGHAKRLAALARAVEGGWRPALAFEQFDRERQGALDAARPRCGRDPDCVIRAGLGDVAPAASGWDWSLYRPLVALALDYDLPVVAANLSRADAARVMREGVAPVLGDAWAARLAEPPAELVAAQRREVEAGHCGKLPAAVVARMADAQIARDAVMAAIVDAHAARGVALIAGNGHVRRDVGVPRWLAAPALSVGYVEEAAAPGVFDVAVAIAPQPRPDPCAAFR
ncbi:putative iron-regulated protein [Crenobacter luteus]|uniref:ChaN family lipoprotein n=1 Tax=Crenobacter luteus TaxID=1452487 RepID=UPI00104FF20E|nr:ChaN family lipoprotein [Crenobacter luteus]TCP15213.1 putative iron-regulated protein [Crenobacter luteus]